MVSFVPVQRNGQGNGVMLKWMNVSVVVLTDTLNISPLKGLAFCGGLSVLLEKSVYVFVKNGYVLHFWSFVSKDLYLVITLNLINLHVLAGYPLWSQRPRNG